MYEPPKQKLVPQKTNSKMQIRQYDLNTTLNYSTGATTPVCVSFNGGAWRGIFFTGIVEYLQSAFTSLELERWSFCGSSAGACYALALAIGYPAQNLKKLLCAATTRARAYILGVTFRVNDITGQIIKDILMTIPEDELIQRLHNRFAVCFSAFSSICCVNPYLAFNFTSKAEVFNACMGSANIPIFSSLTNFPRIGDLYAYDGGITPDGCVPLLPSRCNVFCMCFGDAESRGISLQKNSLPIGVKLDIAEKNLPVPIRECFKCPLNDQEVYTIAEKGRILAVIFFTSDEWLQRFAKVRGPTR